MIYGVFWKKNGKVSLPPFVRRLLTHVVEDEMRWSNGSENSLNIEFFCSLHIDLTRINDAFKGKMYIFAFSVDY